MLYDESTEYDCVFFSESWLNNCLPDSLLDPRAQYAVIRNDRHCGNGGGVCAFVSKRLRCLPNQIKSIYFRNGKLENRNTG